MVLWPPCSAEKLLCTSCIKMRANRAVTVQSDVKYVSLLKGHRNSRLNKRQKQMGEAVKLPLPLPKVFNQTLLLSVH